MFHLALTIYHTLSVFMQTPLTVINHGETFTLSRPAYSHVISTQLICVCLLSSKTMSLVFSRSDDSCKCSPLSVLELNSCQAREAMSS